MLSFTFARLLFDLELCVDCIVFGCGGFRSVSSCTGWFGGTFGVGIHRRAHRVGSLLKLSDGSLDRISVNTFGGFADFLYGSFDRLAIAVLKLVSVLFERLLNLCLLYTSPSPRDKRQSRMPSSA